MVADENRVGHAQGTHGGAEIAISIHFPPVGEIAGDNGELGIGVVMIDVGDGRVEPRSGVEPIEPQAGANEVGIGDLDQLHNRLRQGWRRGCGTHAGPGRSRQEQTARPGTGRV